MAKSECAAALQSAMAIIDSQVTAALTRLDAATGDVDTRKAFHAAFIGRAIDVSRQLFPENMALVAEIEKSLIKLKHCK